MGKQSCLPIFAILLPCQIQTLSKYAVQYVLIRLGLPSMRLIQRL